MIKKLRIYTPYFLGLSAILLGLLVPGGPIENRNFSHLSPVVALSFNIFLTMLGLASFLLIYFIMKKQKWAFKTSFVFGIFYVSIYLLDLAKIFPISPDKMSPLLFIIEIIGTIIGLLLIFSSNSNVTERNKKKKECKQINKVMFFTFILSFIIIGIMIVIFATHSALEPNSDVEGFFMGEHPCNLEPDAGSCEAAMPKYYFDKEEGKCKEFLWGGCDGTVPFDNLDVCKSTCERAIPDKRELTAQFCESDGGRVVNILNDACNNNEIDIGNINSEYICCMITGGSDTNER